MLFSLRSRAKGTDSSDSGASRDGGVHSGAGEGAELSSGLDQDAASYFADRPLSDPAADRFTRWPFAQRIAETVATRSDLSSLVIGLHGPWGDGKTTVLEFIKRRLSAFPAIIPTLFNPWRCGDETHLALSFFKAIEEALIAALPERRKEISELLARYAALTAPAPAQALAADLPHLDHLRTLSSQFSSVEREQCKARIESLLRGERRRLVVMIDDIDRLDRNALQALFRLVRLQADFESTAYILAFDDDMVAAALGERYVSGQAEAGRNFLEKIIQVPLKLPSADRPALRKFCMAVIDRATRASGLELPPEQCQEFVRQFTLGLELRLQTPRMAKRYGNALAFALPLLKGDVHPVDLMLIEGMRIFYPVAYQAVQDRGELYLGIAPAGSSRERAQSSAEHALEEALAGLDRNEREAATQLLFSLFPRFRHLLQGTTATTESVRELEQLWQNEKRVSSRTHFSRYFAYSVSEGEISERELTAFVENAPRQSEAELVAAVSTFFRQSRADAFVSKLLSQTAQMPSAVASSLALAIARSAPLLPKPEAAETWTTTFSQAALLVSQLARVAGAESQRAELAHKIIAEAEPISFAAECFGWMHSGNSPRGERFISAEEEQRLGQAVAARIAAAAEKSPLWKAEPHYCPALFFVWTRFGDARGPGNVIAAQIKQQPADALPLLRCYAQASSGEGAAHAGGQITRAEFEVISRLVDPQDIARALRQAFGLALAADAVVAGNAAAGFSAADLQLARSYLQQAERDESRA